MDNLNSYNNIFMKIFNAKMEDLNEAFEASKIEQWDSVTQMALVGEVEDTFGIMMDIEDIVEFISYEKGKEILKKYQIEV